VGSFTVLFVCYANMCRSPMAERFATHLWRERFGAAAGAITFASAGTDAADGSSMVWGAATVLAEHGADNTGFRSRTLTPAILAGADLVLTATREQRARCVTLLPEAVGHTFTLRQFGRLVTGVSDPALERSHAGNGAVAVATGPEDRLRSLVEQAPAARGRLQPAAPTDDDLADPVGQPIEVFRACATEIRRVLTVVATA
jgi:protein-tyrosine phosphatase